MVEFKREDDDRDDEDGEEELGEQVGALKSLSSGTLTDIPQDYKSQKDAVLFAIDVSKTMLKHPAPSDDKTKDTDSAVVTALKSAYQIMQQRIIAQPKDMMGILLFGTDKSKFRDEIGGRNSPAYPHCYLFADLDVPSAEEVKALKALVEQGEDPDDVLKATPENVSMANVLFCANQIFTTNAPNFGSRRLFIITDNDDPQGDNKAARSAAAVRAKDLYDLGVVIELFPISREEKKFDLSKFYDDIIYRDPAEEAATSEEIKTSKSGDGLTLLNSLISNINSKQTPKRAYFSDVGFEIAPGLTISVKGFLLLHHQKPARTTYIWLGGEKPQIASGETTKMEGGSARSVEKSEIKKAFKFGGEYVYFAPEELANLRRIGEKCIRIIGFKPREKLPLWAAVKKSIFIFPSEEHYVGSTRVFSALWKKLLKSKKVAIAWFVARKNANPIMVAILPSRDPADQQSGTPYMPAGLWLYPLPFADDLRSFEQKNGPVASPETIDDMRPIIQNLQLPKGMYDPSKYPNPSLQWHYKILQALALEEEVPEEPEDKTRPRAKAMAKRVGGYIQQWAEKVDADVERVSNKRSLKREASEETASMRPAKKAKAAPKKTSKDENGPMSTAELKQALVEGKLAKLTIADLKEVCTSRGISSGGKKQDLVDRVEQWLEDN
jgi:ATP-dependent DNA helicase 2 subunit 1